jgi:hypothetical protein
MTAMSTPQRPFERMVAARQRLIDIRTARAAQLMRLRDMLRVYYKEFAANTDPITGARYADVSTDGNKQRGNLEISVTFFEGTRFMIGIDERGEFLHASNPPSLVASIGSIVALEVEEDLSSGKIAYDSAHEPPRRNAVDVVQLFSFITEAAVKSVEAEVVKEFSIANIGTPAGSGLPA